MANSRNTQMLKLNSKSFFLLTFIILLAITGCKKEDGPAHISELFYNFSFIKSNNPGLAEDLNFRIVNQTVVGRIPYTADIREMVASFEYKGTSVSINNQAQQSGVTVNDFSRPVIYTVTNTDGSIENFEIDITWFTGLPIFHINTDDGAEIDTKDEYRPGNGVMQGGLDFQDGSGRMGIRGRGHSTWYFHPKKPYQLKFDEKTEVFGMPEDKKWIFLSEHSDKTLMRNHLAFEMGYISNLEWTPQTVYAEVVLNNDYVGTYTISQKVEESSNRLDLGNDGFLLEIDTPDHLNEGDIYFNSTRFMIQIKEPEVSFNSPQFNYVRDYIIEFENALYSDDFLDSEIGYKKYVDVESFVDWYLINEIAKNQDSRDYSSMYCTLMPGQKLKMGPLWDFDLGFGNVNYSDCEFPTGFWVKYHAWIERMFEDPEFLATVKERFVYYKNNEGYLIGFIDKTANELKYAQEENNDRWDIYGNWIWPNPVVYNSHQEEVDHLKNWFTQRMAWLDGAFNEMN